MDPIEKIDCDACATVYSFLASVFSSHPTEDSIYSLRQMAETLGQTFPAELELNELDHEYMDLFVVPNPRYVAPYESVFRDQWLMPTTLKRGMNPGEASIKIKGLVMGESTEQVQQAYLDSGLIATDDLPDHISNELSYMAYLWHTEAEEPENGATLANQRATFRDEHLLNWIGDLRIRISESDRQGFYLTAVKIVEAVLHGEEEIE